MSAESIALEALEERARQIKLGWVPEHDKEHGALHLLEHVMYRMPESDWIAGEPALTMMMGEEGRRQLIEAIALIIAAVEVMDAE